MRRSLSVLGVALAATLQGCNLGPTAPVEFEANANAPYRLAPGDRLRVIVFGQDSLSNSFAVDSSGHVSMPLIGLVPATGRTPAQLARDIEDKLREGYVRQPRVSVEVEAYRPFFVLGEVTTSGQYPYVNGMNVETAVAIGGGFTARAQKDAAMLTRIEGGRTITAEVPMTQPVRPGDTIVIQERFF